VLGSSFPESCTPKKHFHCLYLFSAFEPNVSFTRSFLLTGPLSWPLNIFELACAINAFRFVNIAFL